MESVSNTFTDNTFDEMVSTSTVVLKFGGIFCGAIKKAKRKKPKKPGNGVSGVGGNNQQVH